MATPLEHAADPDGGGDDGRFLVTVLVDQDTLAAGPDAAEGTCEIDHGPALAVDTVRRLACGSPAVLRLGRRPAPPRRHPHRPAPGRLHALGPPCRRGRFRRNASKDDGCGRDRRLCRIVGQLEQRRTVARGRTRLATTRHDDDWTPWSMRPSGRPVAFNVVSLADAWEDHAGEWIRWAGTPGHDAFWTVTWPEMLAVLPEPGGAVVEIGCGEGRVARRLAAAGYQVVAVEHSPTLARAARKGAPPVAVARGDAGALPMPDRTADLVVACMVLQDVDDLAASVREAGRVLRPGGSMALSIVHPFSSAQVLHPRADGREARIADPYLAERRYEDRVDRDGLGMTFVSAHRPLGAYVDALAAAGLAVVALREAGHGLLPWLLTARAIKLPG